MSFIDSIKSLFKRGGMALTGQSLSKITDHPKIGIDSSEYVRIKQDFDYYSGRFDKVKYINSFTEHKERDFKPLNITKTASARLASIIFNEQCHIALRDIDEDERQEQAIKKQEELKQQQPSPFDDSGNDNNDDTKNDDDSTSNDEKDSQEELQAEIDQLSGPSPLINAANDFLDKTLEDNNFYNLFETNLEKAIASGGFAMRPYIDHDRIKISWIRADQFYPLRSNTNEISECAIATKTIRTEGDESYYYTLLEFHEWEEDKYIISNELYKSDNTNEVGKQVPLATLYDDIADRVEFEGLKRPLFTYFRAPGANHKSLESPLGVGIVDKGKEILDMINQTHDQFWWEIAMSARKVIVPAEYLKTDDAHPPFFDTQQNVFVGVYGAENTDKKITDMTPPLRSVQYKDTISHLLKEFEVQVGLSTGSMSYADDGLKTATEVVSNNSMTYQTRSSYLTMVEKCVKELVHSIFELAEYKELFNDAESTFDIGYDDYDIDISFEDGVFTDKDKQMENDFKAISAGVMPKQEFLKRNYGLSDKEIEDWLGELEDAQAKKDKRMEDMQHQGLLNQGG